MTVSRRLYEAAKPIWQACHDHPFVRGIGDGSLDRDLAPERAAAAV